MVPWLAVASRESLRALRRCGSVSRGAVRALGGGMPCSIVGCCQGTNVEGRVRQEPSNTELLPQHR